MENVSLRASDLRGIGPHVKDNRGAAAWISSSACLCLESGWALRKTEGEWRYFSADLPGDKSRSLTNRPQLGLTTDLSGFFF